MLTNRELQVARLVAQGLTRRDMAQALSITVSAIDKLVHALKAKLGAASHPLLVVRCADLLAERGQAAAGRTTGPLVAHATPPPSPPATTEPATCFDPSAGFDALFSQLGSVLAEFGVTHLAYSHIRAAAPGQIVHLASRWSLPAGVGFDHDIGPSENPTFAYAMAQWAPLPLDLAAMQADASYRFLPDRVRRQTETYLAAGLVRGVSFPLPGPGLSDRLVLSAILKDVGAERFASVVDRHADRMRLIALDFRNAHVAMARPRFRLTEREALLLDRLAEGHGMDEAARAEGISRRAAERCLAAAREAMGVPTTAALLAAHLRNRSDPVLPF